jgi:hypothetical protein
LPPCMTHPASRIKDPSLIPGYGPRGILWRCPARSIGFTCTDAQEQTGALGRIPPHEARVPGTTGPRPRLHAGFTRLPAALLQPESPTHPASRPRGGPRPSPPTDRSSLRPPPNAPAARAWDWGPASPARLRWHRRAPAACSRAPLRPGRRLHGGVPLGSCRASRPPLIEAAPGGTATCSHGCSGRADRQSGRSAHPPAAGQGATGFTCWYCSSSHSSSRWARSR